MCETISNKTHSNMAHRMSMNPGVTANQNQQKYLHDTCALLLKLFRDIMGYITNNVENYGERNISSAWGY